MISDRFLARWTHHNFHGTGYCALVWNSVFILTGLLQAPRHGIHKYSSQLKVFLPDTE